MSSSLFASLNLDLPATNARLATLSAAERTAWAIETFGERLILSSSFGIQAAVSLHLATEVAPNIPVVFIDTGYHFPETYRFVDQLTERLRLNLQVYRAPLTPAWFEARHGKLWEQGVEGIVQYNEIMKVEPMRRALAELGAWAWLAGLRRQQSSTRESLDFVATQDGRLKVHPILDWTDRDVHRYLTAHDLPYHPLREEGYVSIGDTHSTRKLTDGLTEEETRFGGLKRECGLHESAPPKL
jgi:phosphoadenosine phosphosulfate reductase